MNKTNTEFAMIDSFVIDCLVSDTHTLSAEVSEFPTESGQTVTDNIRPKPLVITMECIVSNTPLPEVAAFRQTIVTGEEAVIGDSDQPSDAAYAHLVRVFNNRQPVTIRTSIKTYENMVLKELSIPRSSSTGDALQFTATFQQVTLVSVNRTDRVAIPVAKNTKTVNKPPKPAGLVSRKVDPYDGTWYDPDINGWREGATYNSKEGHWEFFKGRPLHQSTHSWQTGDRLSDQGYRDQNEAGLIPLDKKTGKVNQNIGQQFQLVTDPSSIDAWRNAGAADQSGVPLP